MAIEGSVPQNGVLVPHLVVRDAAEAVDFYGRAFGAQILFRSPSPSGQGEHIHVKVWLRKNKMEAHLLASPESLGGSTCVFQVGVPDVDAAYRKAIDEGAVPAMPPMDMFWGDRYGWVRDPFGHVWTLCTVKEVLTAAEVEARMQRMFKEAR
jgi:uncharacterized glyoxalase superfamily protein PhnB